MYYSSHVSWVGWLERLKIRLNSAQLELELAKNSWGEKERNWALTLHHPHITGKLGLPSVHVSRHQQDLTLSLTQIQGLAYFC